MAKNRLLNTSFWDDEFVAELKPTEKLLFLYFLTNTLTNICGCYKITEKRIAYDTGMDRLSIKETIKKFSEYGKIFYENGWIFIKNFPKHQKANNPKVKIGIEKAIADLPQEVAKRLESINSLSIGYAYPSNNINSNFNSNSNSNLNKKETAKADELLEFFNKTCETNLKMTKGKRTQIKNRLETFSIDEIKQAIVARTKSSWHAGQNEQNKIWYKDWDSLFRNDEKIDKMLNSNTKAVITQTIRNDRGQTFQKTEAEIEELRKAGKIKYDDKGKYFLT